ncbi:MAG: tetratricopeptide repeat protein, partial [Saprospiraceae bacterium]|nr:tetratricopeptide repeat protein [Saprospiraceae bacterium]
LDNLDKAEETFKSALDASPYNFHVINNLATVYIRQQRCPEALILLDRALELNSLFDEALFNSAYCLHTLGRYDEALEKVMQVPQESERKRQFILEISKAIEMKSNN